MVTRSIELTEEEAAAVREYVAATGEAEASVLREAALRGLREIRLERGMRAYRQGASSSEAAEIAGMGRAEFLWLGAEEGLILDDGPPNLPQTLEYLGSQLDDPKLTDVARKLREARD